MTLTDEQLEQALRDVGREHESDPDRLWRSIEARIADDQERSARRGRLVAILALWAAVVFAAATGLMLGWLGIAAVWGWL